MVLPACSTSLQPSLTLLTEVPMSCLISRAAVAERPAKLRTSLATTAKPRPCSPARAASTAALSAKMLVWNAMPSITPMMSAILRDDVLIASMVCTTCDTTVPPRTATWDADSANWLAWRLLSVLRCTVWVSSCIEAVVCSSALAWCSVRADRSWLPAAIWPLALATDWEPWRTLAMILPSDWFMSCRAWSSWPHSSWRTWVTTCRLRSPAATQRASCTASAKGRVMEREIATASSKASTAAARPKASNQSWAVEMVWLSSALLSLTVLCCACTKALIGVCKASRAGRVSLSMRATAASRSPA